MGLKTQGLTITIQSLKTIALTAPQGMKSENFRASSGWVQKFMARNNIIRKKTHLTSKIIANLNQNILTSFDHIQNILSWGDSSFMFFNLDEIPVYTNTANDFTMHIKGEKQMKVLTHRSAKTRITFMLCVSRKGHILEYTLMLLNLKENIKLNLKIS